MCAVCDSCARSAAIFCGNVSVMSTQWVDVGCAITHTSGTDHASSPSSWSSVVCVKGLRASG